MTYNAETRQEHYYDANKRLRQVMKIVPIGKRFRVIGSNGKTLFTAATKSDCQNWVDFNYPMSDNQDNTFSNSKESKAMKTKAIKMGDFLKAANINPKLAGAVIRQFGGWDYFKEQAQDVANHGIDGGYCGFIYYAETVAFTKKHKKAIVENVKQFADDVGESFTKVIAGFNCLKDSGITENDIIMALISPRSCNDYGLQQVYDDLMMSLMSQCSCDEDVLYQVYNALAWYAGETVAREYVDFVYNPGNGD